MTYEVSLLVALTGLIVRVLFYMNRSRERELAEQRAADERRRADGDDDPALLALIREQENGAPRPARRDAASPFRTPGKVPRSRRRGGAPVADVVLRRCERCDMRVSPDQKYCGPCTRALAP